MTTQLVAMTFLCAALTLVSATVVGGTLARLGFPVPDQSRRIGCIDGLRGYLAVCVFVYHGAIWVRNPAPEGMWSGLGVDALGHFGLSSVALFFMASGLVFYPKILEGLSGVSWPGFFVSRIFRIIPLVAASTLLITLIVALRTGARPDWSYPRDAFKWVIAWAQVPLLGEPQAGRLNAYVLWSIWYEWLFYIFVVPACAALSQAMRGRLPSWTLPATLLVGSQALVVAGFRPSIVPHLPMFALGMIAFECQRRGRLAAILRTQGATVLSVAGLFAGFATTSSAYGVSMAAFALFFVCVACGNSFWGALRTRGALVLGECSYGIYLMHGIVLSILFTEGGPLIAGWPKEWTTLLLPCAIAAVVVLTATAHLTIEKPAIRLGHVLARWMTRRRDATRLSKRR